MSEQQWTLSNETHTVIQLTYRNAINRNEQKVTKLRICESPEKDVYERLLFTGMGKLVLSIEHLKIHDTVVI